uniref:Uncharacterized protein n=1 Tax=Panagrellus redivivus TaxID=6233 RepID=A0A7E4ZZX9_PANRE
MASFTNIWLILILCFTFVLNVKSEEPQYPSESTHTINVTCDAYPTYKLRGYQYIREYRQTLSDIMRSLLTCNFTLADVQVQADVFFSIRDHDESNIADTLWDVLDSKLEAVFSPYVFEKLQALTRSAISKEFHFFNIRHLLTDLRYEPFSLSGFPQVELYMADITNITPAKKVESEQPPLPSESSPTMNMACKSQFPYKLRDYKSSIEYKNLLSDRISVLLTCNFTVAEAEFQADVLYLGHIGDVPYFGMTFDSVLSSKMKTNVSPDVFEILDLLAESDPSKSSRSAYIKSLLNTVKSQPLLLTGFPQVELIVADVTQISPAKKVKLENIKITCEDNDNLLKVITLITFKNNSDFMKRFEKGNFIGNESLDSLIASKFSYSNCAISTNNGQNGKTIQQKPSIEVLLDNASQVKNFLKLFNTTAQSAEDVEPKKPFTSYVLTFTSNTLKFMVYNVFFDPIVSILAQFVVVPILVFTFCNRLDF